MNVITVSELRRKLPEIMYRVLLDRESFVVMKNGRRFATLSPVEEGDGSSRKPKPVARRPQRRRKTARTRA